VDTPASLKAALTEIRRRFDLHITEKGYGAHLGRHAAEHKDVAGTLDRIPTGVGGSAPTGASYVTISAEAGLTSERRVAAGNAIGLTDGGANSTLTIALNIAGQVIGDIIYHTGAAWARLAGNTTVTKKFLTQTGDGAASAAPAWGTIVAADLPVGIADDKIVQIDSADVADNEYAKFTANGIEGRSYAEVISDLGLKTVATDTIWAAAGDLAVGTGNDTAGVLTKGTDGKVLTMVAGAVAWAAAAGGGAMATDPLWDAAGDLAVGTGADAGAKLTLTVPGAANLMNVLGVVNAESTPTWKVLFDGTAPEAVGTAAAGTGVVAAHRNHVHAHGTPTSHDRRITCAVYLTPVSDTVPKWISPPLPLSTIISAEIKSYTACGATAQVIDIHKQTAANKDTNTAATIWSTHANCLSLTNTHYQAETTTFDVTAIAEGDRLYVFSHVLGTGLTVAYITVTIRPT